jgi:hypothetical protein
MKRDMDTVRRILREAEELPVGQELEAVDDLSNEEFSVYVQWLVEAGLVEAGFFTTSEGTFTTGIARLTWDGCDFMDAARSDNVWNKAKERVLKPGMSFTFDLLKDWLKAEISQGFPTLRG